MAQPASEMIPAATVIGMFQDLTRTLDQAIERVHTRIGKVEGDLRACQERRNEFHAKEVPEYNQHIRCTRRKSDRWYSIKTTVIAGVILMAFGQSFAVIYYLHNLIERIPK